MHRVFCDDNQSLFVVLNHLARTQEESTTAPGESRSNFDPPFQNGCTTDLLNRDATVTFHRFTSHHPTVSVACHSTVSQPMCDRIGVPDFAQLCEVGRCHDSPLVRRLHGCSTASLTDARWSGPFVASVADFLDTVSRRWQPATVTPPLPCLTQPFPASFREPPRNASTAQ